MFTPQELENIRTGTNLVSRYCECGCLVEQVPSVRFLHRNGEIIICPKCGRDNSWKPPFLSKLKRILKRVLA